MSFRNVFALLGDRIISLRGSFSRCPFQFLVHVLRFTMHVLASLGSPALVGRFIGLFPNNSMSSCVASICCWVDYFGRGVSSFSVSPTIPFRGFVRFDLRNNELSGVADSNNKCSFVETRLGSIHALHKRRPIGWSRRQSHPATRAGEGGEPGVVSIPDTRALAGIGLAPVGRFSASSEEVDHRRVPLLGLKAAAGA